VLGEDGEIRPEDANFTVTPEGEIVDSQGDTIDTLLITQPAENARVQKYANGLYGTENPNDNIPAEGTVLVQGARRSNPISILTGNIRW
jgi:flagellar basal body rod protein FlgG